MIELFRDANYDFLGKKWYCIGLSLVVLAVGAASLIRQGGPRLGIDFRGGTLVYVKFAQPPDLDSLRRALATRGLGSSTIQRYGPEENHELIIGLEQQGSEQEALDTGRLAIRETLRTTFAIPTDKLNLNQVGLDTLTEQLLAADPIGLAAEPAQAAARYRQIATTLTRVRDTERGGLFRSFNELRTLEGVPPAVANFLEANAFLSPFVVREVEIVGPKVGRLLRRRALWATLSALGGVLFYIGWRFRHWMYGSAAVLAVFHDVAITLGFLSLFNYEISLNVVAALLTLVGYSVNDTIVVFDRIRENVRLLRREPFGRLVNRSINQTLSRTVLTSCLTIVSVLALFLFGGEVLKGFAFTLVVGFIVGTYSTLFIASPFVVGWIERKQPPAGHTGAPARADKQRVELAEQPRASASSAGRKGR
ncbi:MAG: protein translocase subunit SecF [Terriglobia bacterium]